MGGEFLLLLFGFSLCLCALCQNWVVVSADRPTDRQTDSLFRLGCFVVVIIFVVYLNLFCPTCLTGFENIHSVCVFLDKIAIRVVFVGLCY